MCSFHEMAIGKSRNINHFRSYPDRMKRLLGSESLVNHQSIGGFHWVVVYSWKERQAEDGPKGGN